MLETVINKEYTFIWFLELKAGESNSVVLTSGWGFQDASSVAEGREAREKTVMKELKPVVPMHPQTAMLIHSRGCMYYLLKVMPTNTFELEIFTHMGTLGDTNHIPYFSVNRRYVISVPEIAVALQCVFSIRKRRIY